MAVSIVDAHGDLVAFGKMDRRVAGLLIQRFSRDRAFAATHEELAVELGTAREVVSRLLKDFERMGAIAMARTDLPCTPGIASQLLPPSCERYTSPAC